MSQGGNHIPGTRNGVREPLRKPQTAKQISDALLEWMDEEEMAPDWLKEIDWVNDYDASKISQEFVDRVEGTIEKFSMTKTKMEFYEEGVKRRILTAPISTIKDLWENPQLRAREYWMPQEHPELADTLTYCGPFIKLSESPITHSRRAPLIGEHNNEIYKELGPIKKIVFIKKRKKGFQRNGFLKK